MTRHKNLLILFFCSMCISVAGQPCAVKSLVPILHLKLRITFVRGICKAMWSAIKVLN